jgi:hypothetical protein
MVEGRAVPGAALCRVPPTTSEGLGRALAAIFESPDGVGGFD